MRDFFTVTYYCNCRMEELVGIASWPTSENVFTVDEFSDLQDAVNKVRDAICNGKV